MLLRLPLDMTAVSIVRSKSYLCSRDNEISFILVSLSLSLSLCGCVLDLTQQWPMHEESFFIKVTGHKMHSPDKWEKGEKVNAIELHTISTVTKLTKVSSVAPTNKTASNRRVHHLLLLALQQEEMKKDYEKPLCLWFDESSSWDTI